MRKFIIVLMTLVIGSMAYGYDPNYPYDEYGPDDSDWELESHSLYQSTWYNMYKSAHLTICMIDCEEGLTSDEWVKDLKDEFGYIDVKLKEPKLLIYNYVDPQTFRDYSSGKYADDDKYVIIRTYGWGTVHDIYKELGYIK